MEKVEITLAVRVGEGGKLFGSITGKDISNTLKKDFNIDIDKRKIELTHEIKSLGDYEAIIKVHPTITAKITLHIVAK